MFNLVVKGQTKNPTGKINEKTGDNIKRVKQKIITDIFTDKMQTIKIKIIFQKFYH